METYSYSNDENVCESLRIRVQFQNSIFQSLSLIPGHGGYGGYGGGGRGEWYWVIIT